ncbi:hypothetical protein [Gluconobacter roseus]|uniref:hypothetical protein n=1 Tax=Gluconobacter roseus TaxID=586239 RepID=UPI0038D0018E
MSLPPFLRSKSAYIRYMYAQTHLEKLREQLSLAEKLDNFELESLPDDERKKTIRCKNPPPVLLSLLLGDVIYSLRSALDYVTCGLVTLNKPNADLSHVQFPFGRKGERLNSGQRKRIESISDEALGPVRA